MPMGAFMRRVVAEQDERETGVVDLGGDGPAAAPLRRQRPPGGSGRCNSARVAARHRWARPALRRVWPGPPASAAALPEARSAVRLGEQWASPTIIPPATPKGTTRPRIRPPIYAPRLTARCRTR